MGSADPLEKWMKNQRAKTCTKRAVFYVYVIFREQSGQAGVENGAMLTTYLDILQNAPFRSQILKKNFRLRRQGSIDPPADVPGSFIVAPQLPIRV